tara:strand:+ start:171 stop:392 length:222 start_codon:yes stop_codon:yes gene_type:complete
MKVWACPNCEIKLGGGILWEVTWQRPNEDMHSQLVLLPPFGWSDPQLSDALPSDVIKALLKKYGLQNEKFLYD